MRDSSTTCDTSVLIAAFDPNSPGHLECNRALERVSVLPAHAMLEAYSVLTRLPGELRYPPAAVAQVFQVLDRKIVQLPGELYLSLVTSFAEGNRPGGAIYDGQIAATAKHFGLRLLSRDRRAARTYELVGADYELIGEPA